MKGLYVIMIVQEKNGCGSADVSVGKFLLQIIRMKESVCAEESGESSPWPILCLQACLGEERWDVTGRLPICSWKVTLFSWL